MDERKPRPTESAAESTADASPVSEGRSMLEQAFARGTVADATPVAIERTEHSVMEGLPPAKAERIAAMRRELAELQRQLIEAQQRIATELQGRAEDAERLETTEARLHEHEAKVHEGAAREAALASELANLNTQLSAIGATTEELRRQVASRETQLEDARQQHRDATARLEAQTASLADTKAQLETRAADLAARTTERDSEQAAKARLEQELADERKKHGEAAGQLESHVASLRDANALVATRDAELMAIAKERDAVNAEIRNVPREAARPGQPVLASRQRDARARWGSAAGSRCDWVRADRNTEIGGGVEAAADSTAANRRAQRTSTSARPGPRSDRGGQVEVGVRLGAIRGRDPRLRGYVRVRWLARFELGSR